MIRPGAAGDVDDVLALWGAERSAHAVTDDTPAALRRALPALLVAEEDGGQMVGAVLAADDLWRGSF